MEYKIETICVTCQKKLRIPSDRGKLKIICPHCSHKWYWYPCSEEDQVNPEDQQGINLLILGKTGVGKSSFCNYVFGLKDIFAVGKGERGTDWDDHFRSHSFRYANHTLNIFDSVGIEANNLEEWDERLQHLLKSRNENIEASPMEWIHGVLYLINANSARIEQVEIDRIKRIMSNNIPVHIVLTNIDVAAGKEKALRETLFKELSSTTKSSRRNNFINIHEVCSVSIRTRKGVSEPSGKEEVLETFLAELDKKLRIQILSHFIDKMSHTVKQAQRAMIMEVTIRDLGIFTKIKAAWNDALAQEFTLDARLEKIVKSYQEYVAVLDAFIDSLGYRSESTVLEEIEGISAALRKKIQKAKSQLQEDISEISFLDSIYNLNKKIYDRIDDSLKPLRVYLDGKKHEVNHMFEWN